MRIFINLVDLKYNYHVRFVIRKYRSVNMSLFIKRFKKKGVSDEKNKREGNLASSSVNVSEVRVSDVMGIL